MNLLIDINGVLYVGDLPVPGAAAAVESLRMEGHKLRFVSNATRISCDRLQDKLSGLGFEIPPGEIFTAPRAAIRHILDSGKSSCFLLSAPDARRDFEHAGITLTAKEPDFVVVADAAENFSYANMNLAFNLLLSGAGFIALEEDRYWMAKTGLELSAGPYVKALEYASGKKAVLVGKPSPDFFSLALKEMGAKKEDSAMVGDDIYTDVGGAQDCGLRAFLVKTGKYRKEEVEKSRIRPDLVLDSISDLHCLI